MRRPLLSMLISFVFVTGLAEQADAQGEKDKSDTPSVRLPQAGVVPFDAETAKKLQKAWAKHLSAAETAKNSMGMELILIPPGEFQITIESRCSFPPLSIIHSQLSILNYPFLHALLSQSQKIHAFV